MPKDLRNVLSIMGSELAKLRKDLGEEVPDETAQTSGAAQIVKVLEEAQTKIGELLTKAQKGGEVPEGFGTDLKTLAGALLAIANASGGASPPGLQNMVANGGTVTESEKRDGGWVIKALAPEVEAAVTMNTAQDFMYGAMSLMREGKLDEAKAKITSIVGMLGTVTAGAPAEGDAMKNAAGTDETKVTVQMTQEEFVTWSLGQLEAAASDTKEVALKRIANLQKAVEIASSFWDGSDRTTNPLVTSIEMVSFFAPEGDGKKGDVTATKDQASSETPATAGTPDRNQLETGVMNGALQGTTANQGTNSMSTDTGADSFAWPAFKNLRDKLATSIAAMGQPVAKREGFMWPMDMSVDEEAEVARQTAINKAETPRTSEDDWGRDPWAATT